jgi:FkbM family methyltransferase
MIRSIILKFFNFFGLKISKISFNSSSEKRLNYLFIKHGIDTVFDVGANEGQFALELIRAGFKGRIVSFEPISFVYNRLFERSKSFDNWLIPERCAIGEKDEIVTINISDSSASSSIKKMTTKHTDAAPNTHCNNTEKTKVKPLDSFSHYLSSNSPNLFLKIDTQGFELQVLKGAKSILDKTKIVQLELSLVELYEGQELYDKLISYMSEKGFDVWFLDPAFIDPRNGRLLQVDAIFLNRKLCS